MAIISKSEAKQFAPAAFNRVLAHARILKASFAPNKKGNPMVTVEYELYSPHDAPNAEGTKSVIAGQKGKTFFVLVDRGVHNWLNLREKLSLDCEAVDTENPVVEDLVGKNIKGLFSCTESFAQEENGEPTLDPDTGEKISTGFNLQLNTLIGASNVDPSASSNPA